MAIELFILWMGKLRISQMTYKALVKGIILLVMVVIFVGCSGDVESVVEDTVNAEELIKVTEAYGKVMADEKQNIIIEFPGKITDVMAENGQLVHIGDVLFNIDLSEYKQALREHENMLAMKQLELSQSALMLGAEASELIRLTDKYDELKSKYDNGSVEEMIQLRNQITTNQTTYDRTVADLSNSVLLLDEGVISKNEYENMDSTKVLAGNALMSSQLDYSVLKKTISEEIDALYYSIQSARSRVIGSGEDAGPSSIDFELIQMEVYNLQEKYDRMLSQLEKPYLKENGDVICHIKEGVFYDFMLIQGDYLSGSPDTKAYSIASNETLVVEAEISEDFIKDIEIGAIVYIRPVASRETTYVGTVSYIADRAYASGGDSVIMVQTTIDDNDGFLKQNFSVDIEIEAIRDEMLEQ